MVRWGPFLAAVGLLTQGSTEAFYLPGGAPKSFQPGVEVDLQVVQLTSTKTQIPHDYYYAPYCTSSKHTKEPENLGELLMGDKIESSPYSLIMNENVHCKFLCERDLSQADVERFQYLIDNHYRVHMQVDNFPVAAPLEQPGLEELSYPVNDRQLTRGFSMGYKAGDTRYLANHLTFIVKYHKAEHFEGGRIVGFEVIPSSVQHHAKETGTTGDVEGGDGDNAEQTRRQRHLEEKRDIELTTCQMVESPDPNIPRQTVNEPGKVYFTYNVRWEEDTDTPWSNRWDKWLKSNPESEIHYFSIVNSLMITLFLTGVVAMIMLRTLRKDISTYNEMQTLEDAQEESGWKLVHGDVFRPPSFSPMLLSILCGTGVQVFAMTLSTITFAFLGFLSPANRGGMLTAVLVLFALMGPFAGYWSATVYKFFNGKKWKRSTLATALFFPTSIFTIYWALDLMLWSRESSTAVSVSTFVRLLVLWFFVSVPLVFVGSYFGFRAETYTIPVRVNQIARHVPEQMWYTHPAFAIALGGILPFGAVCIELFFIMSSLWLHQIYYVFSFLYVVFFILIATCAEITMVMCYFQLCNEDYRWWWRAFLSAGSSAGYLYVYSVWFFFSKLPIEGFVSSMIYFGYMFMIATTFFLLTGSSGFFACFWFVRKIYGAIKVD